MDFKHLKVSSAKVFNATFNDTVLQTEKALFTNTNHQVCSKWGDSLKGNWGLKFPCYIWKY